MSLRTLRPNDVSRLTVLAALVLVLAACSQTLGDQVDNVDFDGRRYLGGPAAGYRFTSAELTWIGQADRVMAAVEGRDVYRLDGVDPGNLIVMRSALERSPYYVLFAKETLTPNASGDAIIAGIPGLCTYVVYPVEGC